MDQAKRPKRPAGKMAAGGVAALILLAGPWLASAQETAQGEALKMETAIRLALQNNERAISAEQNVVVADAQLKKARAYFLPTLNVTGSYTRRPFEVARLIGNQNIIVQSYNSLSGAANFSLTLFDSRSLPALLQANSEYKADVLSTSDSKRLLAFEVASAFVGTLSQDQVLEASKSRLDFAKQSLDAAKARFAAGLVSSNDVTRAELEYATAEVGVTQAKGQVDTTYLNLGYLLNAPTPTKLDAPESLFQAATAPLAPAEELIAQALARRPDISSLRWMAKGQHDSILDPTLKWLPSLTLTGRYTYTNEPGLTGRSFNWNTGLTMSWSVFDGLTRNNDYFERRALAFKADLSLKSALRKVEVDVRGAIVSLESQRAALRQATIAHDIATRNAAETYELYRQGLSSALEVADANVRLFEAAVNLVRARYGLAVSYLSLESALGLDPLGKEPAFEND